MQTDIFRNGFFQQPAKASLGIKLHRALTDSCIASTTESTGSRSGIRYLYLVSRLDSVNGMVAF